MNEQTGISTLIYVLIMALIVWRMTRPTRISVARIWARPALLLLFTAFAIWGEQQTAHAPIWEVAAVFIVGAIIGIPFGAVRGKHSEVKATERPGVFFVHSSPLVVVIWLLAFVARAVIRYLMPGAAHGVTLWTLGLLGFAVSAITISAFIVHGKLQAATAPHPPPLSR